MAVAGVLGTLLSLVLPLVASAHTPHDTIIDVEMSPDFATDRTVYAISRSYLLKSTDAGTSWTRLVRGITGPFRLSSIAVSTQDADTLYLSSQGGGVLRSEDGGESWTRRSSGLTSPYLAFVEVSPHSDDTVLAANPEENGKLWRTDDGGGTWAAVEGLSAVRAVAFAADDPDALFAGDRMGRIFVSSNRGETWRAHELDADRTGGIRRDRR